MSAGQESTVDQSKFDFVLFSTLAKDGTELACGTAYCISEILTFYLSLLSSKNTVKFPQLLFSNLVLLRNIFSIWFCLLIIIAR